MYWQYSPVLFVVCTLFMLSVSVPTALSSHSRGNARGARPPCPSDQCKCRWTATKHTKNQVKVVCSSFLGNIPAFTPTQHIYKSLSFHNRNISQVPLGAFTNVQAKELDLSGNWLDSENCIDPQAFLGLGETVQVLVLRDNSLPYIPADSLSLLSELHRLHLEYNNITHVPGAAFANNSQLKELYLYNNHITILDINSFTGLKGLHHLKLMNNFLKHISAGTFDSLTRLISLDLSANNLLQVPDGAFSNLRRLNWLELQGNQIAEVTTKSFRGLKKLRHIKLEANPLRHFGNKTMRAVRNLRYLSMDISYIKNMNPKLFKGLKKLKMLVLGDLHTVDLSPSLFGPLIGLRYMTAFNHTGKFLSLSHGVFPENMDIQGLNIWVSPIGSCKCKIPWIKDLTTRGVYIQGQCRRGARMRRLSCRAQQFVQGESDAIKRS